MFEANYPFAFWAVVAFGATCLVAFGGRLASEKIRPSQDGHRNALLLATGFAWGRFIGMDVVVPKDLGAMTGAIAALFMLWFLRHIRSIRTSEAASANGS
jgi:predicted permease